MLQVWNGPDPDFKKMEQTDESQLSEPSFPALAGTAQVSAVDCRSNVHLRLQGIDFWEWIHDYHDSTTLPMVKPCGICGIYQQQLSVHVTLTATWRQTSNNNILTRYRDIATKRHKNHMPRHGMTRVQSTRARFPAGAAREIQGPVITKTSLHTRRIRNRNPFTFQEFPKLFVDWVFEDTISFHTSNFICLSLLTSM